MRKFGRRSFFKTMGLGTLAASSLPASIARALAIPANDRTGTIEDIEHIVILMQEVRSADHDPRTYTVEAGKSLSDVWPLALEGIPDCDLSVYGPNGFFRSFKGSVAALRKAQLLVLTDYDSKGGDVTLVITNRAAQSIKVSVLDMYKGKTTALQIGAGVTVSDRRSLSRESGWYDFVITTDADASIEYHVAGHVESGKDSISDPAIGSI